MVQADPGEHLAVSRFGYTHHGIMGHRGVVIHFTGEPTSKKNARIRRTPIVQFAQGGVVRVVKYGACLPFSETVRRAESRLGESGYDLFHNNCEHFARWCKTEKPHSDQIDDGLTTAAGTVGGASAVAAGLSTVSASGAVAGMSGAGIMSGLATVGGAVGTGAVGGLAILGTAPAVVTTIGMHRVLRDDQALPQAERDARKAGRAATKIGAIGGAGVAVAAVSTAGTTGLSAAGITSGLAAIGGTVGGGMATGTVATIAAPAVLAAGVGYGAYRAWKWFSE